MLLTGSIIFHIIHATFFLDFWSIWVGPKDIPEAKAEMMREFGIDAPGPKPGKYPLGNRLYHLAVLVAGAGCDRDGAADDVAGAHADLRAQPVSDGRRRLRLHLRAARSDRRRLRRD